MWESLSSPYVLRARCCLCLWIVNSRLPLRCSLPLKNNIISKVLPAVSKYIYANRRISNKGITTGTISGEEIAYNAGTSYSTPVLSCSHVVQCLVFCIIFSYYPYSVAHCIYCHWYLQTLIKWKLRMISNNY